MESDLRRTQPPLPPRQKLCTVNPLTAAAWLATALGYSPESHDQLLGGWERIKAVAAAEDSTPSMCVQGGKRGGKAAAAILQHHHASIASLFKTPRF